MPISNKMLRGGADREVMKKKPWSRAGEETIFKKWIQIKRLTYTEVAVMIGVSKRSISFWADGQLIPGLLPAIKIEEISEGKVPAVSWLNTLLGRTLWATLNRSAFNEKEEAETPRYRSHVGMPKPAQASPPRTEGAMHPTTVRRPKGRGKAGEQPVSQGKATGAKEKKE